MEEWEHQIVELKSSLKSKDTTILRLRRYIEVYKREFARRELEYQEEISTLGEQVKDLKHEKKILRSKVKKFVKLKRKEMKIMKKQLSLLERQQAMSQGGSTDKNEVQAPHLEQTRRSSILRKDILTSTVSDGRNSPIDTGPIGSQAYLLETDLVGRSNPYLRQLEREYISQIDKYKDLLESENEKLKSTRSEFVEYVQDKTKEIDSLQDQIRGLKDYILNTNSELNLMTHTLPRSSGNNKDGSKLKPKSSKDSLKYSKRTRELLALSDSDLSSGETLSDSDMEDLSAL